jgi:Na+/H+ antiporter NhaD/arsenite permease-like protein
MPMNTAAPADLSVLAIFGLTYAGMATGRIPGFRTDRAGIALAAAILILIATGKSPAEAVGWVDLPTLALLFGLMVLSGKFSLSGFYDYCAFRISHAAGSPQRLLAVTIIVAAALSAVLANDIIAFAMPPLLCLGLRGRGLNPVPYLIGLAAATNVGSAATVIGNPQNILIGQVGQLDFWRFIALCGVPAVLGLGVVYAVIAAQWRHRWVLRETALAASDQPPSLRRGPLLKAAVLTVALLIAFGVGLPRDISALIVAAAVFVSRSIESQALVRSVDWGLLILFGGLFIVTGAVADLPEAGILFSDLIAGGWAPDHLSILAPLTLLMSNTIGNVPCVILLLQVWQNPPTEALYGLALFSTLAGNLLITGSLANIIVVERARGVGVHLSFLDHARAGIPITILTMGIAAAWLLAIGVIAL